MFCDTNCWSCEDKNCKFYKSKQELFFEVKDYKLIIDEAIKYIKKLDDDYTDYDGEIVIGDISDTAKRNLLSILNGK